MSKARISRLPLIPTLYECETVYNPMASEKFDFFHLPITLADEALAEMCRHEFYRIFSWGLCYEMYDYALLTGAGASVPLGFPTTAQFFSKGDRPWSISPPQLFDLVKQHLGAPSKPPDVEEVLGLLDPAADFFAGESGKFIARVLTGRLSKPFDNLPSQIPAAAEEIKRRCHDLYGLEPNRGEVTQLYEPLFEKLEWKERAIPWFTTNYDRTAQAMLRIAHDRGVGRADGFVVNSEYSPSEFDSAKTGLKVYRLHGAIHWFVENDIFKDQVHGSYVLGRRAFIPPGFKGDPRRGPDGPHKDAHIQFESELKKVKCLVVIGFSFRDIAINQILRDALEVNQSLVIRSINPNTPNHNLAGWEQLAADFKDRIGYIHGEFGQPTVLDDFTASFGLLGPG